MWVLSSDQDAPCVRPLKPPKNEEGPEASYNPSIWIRPGKEYTAGRSEVFDLCITHPKLSRKKLGFTLRSSPVDPGSVLLQQEREIYKPSYSLVIEAGEQGLLALDDSGSDVEIKPGCKYTIQDGMSINAFADKRRECIMKFRWRPIHIYNRIAKKRDLPDIQQALAPLGITFTSYHSKMHPDPSHTHALFPKFSVEPSATQLIAANCQLLMVGPGWFDALLKATAPEELSSGGEESRKVEKSKLELDFERNWPSEPRYFPSVDGREATGSEKKIWDPDPRRSTLYRDTVFVDCSVDPNVAVLATTAGGKVCSPDINNTADLVTALSAFCKDTGIPERRMKKYFILPHYGTLFSPQQHSTIREAKEALRLDGYIRATSIFTSIKDVLPLQDISREYDIPKDGGEDDALPPPTPSMPGATADIVYPATHPGDVAASAPKQAVDLKRPNPPTSANEARPNKKPRKLADRGIVDPFANLFSTSNSAAVTAPPMVESAEETQLNSQMSSIHSKRSAAAETEDSQSQSKFLRPDSKYSKLKRRVGQGSSTQLTAMSELDTVEENEMPLKQKFKSFDPSIESVTSQATARIQEIEQKQKLNRLLDDDGEDVKPITAKRKVVEVQPDSDEETSREATQKSSRKKTTQTKEETKAGKKQTEENDKVPSKENVYLQIKTGRRKIGKNDADINEDFNNLRIKKTQAAESHKMGWNERDIFQEEMAEDAGWEAEDKSTFFQIRFVPMVRPKKTAEPAAAVDPRYAGRANFKAFKPKASVASTSRNGAQRRDRPNVPLVVYEAPDYGLQDSYSGREPRQDDNDSDVSIDMPMPDLDNIRKGKGKGRAPAPAKTKKGGKGKRAVVSDSSEEDELDAQESSTAREESAPAATTKGRPKESITIDSSSDEEDGRTFKGFSASNRITARKR